MSHSVGSTVWVFDGNRRVYRRDERGHAVGAPIFREHFRPASIVGETPRSWVLATGHKVPKQGGDIREAGSDRHGKARVYMTEDAVDDAAWLDDNQWRLAEHLRHIRDVEILRKVAALIGYREQAKEGR